MIFLRKSAGTFVIYFILSTEKISRHLTTYEQTDSLNLSFVWFIYLCDLCVLCLGTPDVCFLEYGILTTIYYEIFLGKL